MVSRHIHKTEKFLLNLAKGVTDDTRRSNFSRLVAEFIFIGLRKKTDEQRK